MEVALAAPALEVLMTKSIALMVSGCLYEDPSQLNLKTARIVLATLSAHGVMMDLDQ